MAKETIGDLYVAIRPSLENFDAETNRAVNESKVKLKVPVAVDSAQARTAGESAGQAAGSGFSSHFSSAIKGALAVTGLAGLSVGLKSFFSDALKDTQNAVLSTLSLQRVIGGSVADVSRLNFALNESRVNTDAANASFKIFETGLSKTQGTSKGVSGELQKLGISYKDVNGQLVPMTQLLPRISEKFAAMPDGVNKSAAAVALFGRGGLALLPFLNQGPEKIAELEKEADKLGVTLSSSTVKGVQSYIDTQKQWKATQEGLMLSIGQLVLPVMNGLEKILKDLAGAATKYLIPALKDIGRWAADVLGPIKDFFTKTAAGKDILIGIAAVITVSLLPALYKMIAAMAVDALEAFGSALIAVASGFYDAAAAALTFIATNPEIAALAVVVGVVAGAMALFGSHERSAKVDTQALTDAVKAQNGVFTDLNPVIAEMIANLDKIKVGSRGEDATQYFQRYGISVHDLAGEMASPELYKGLDNLKQLRVVTQMGDRSTAIRMLTADLKSSNPALAAWAANMLKVFNDKSVSSNTRDQLVKLAVSQVQTLHDTQAAQEAHDKAIAEGAPKVADYTANLKALGKANADLQTALIPVGQTLSSQIDLFKGVADASTVSFDTLMKNAQQAADAFINESANVAKLTKAGLSADVISGLVKEGPQYVAAVAKEASDAGSAGLAQVKKYGALQTQAIQNYEADKLAVLKATEPKQYQAIIDAQNKARQPIVDGYLNTLETPVKNTIGQIQSIVKQAGGQLPDNFAQKLLQGKDSVLAASIAAFPDPIKKAIQQSVANIEAGKGPAITQAQALADGVNAQSAKIITSLGITITSDDQASDKIKNLQGVIAGFNQFAVTSGLIPALPAGVASPAYLKAVGKASGGLITGPGSGTSDSIPAWLSNGEYVIPAATVKQLGIGFFDSIRTGYAAGGLVRPSESMSETLNLENIIGAITPKIDLLSAAATPVGAGVQRWVPDIFKVLSLLGLPASLMPRVASQMQLESGGDPTAINLTDSNAAKGDPSKGLMQTIQETFDEWAGQFRSLGIWNGFANLFAGVNYAAHRYAGDPNIGLGYGHGYDNGGFLMPGYTLAFNGTGKPERIRTHEQEAALNSGGVVIQSVTVNERSDVDMLVNTLAFHAKAGRA